MQRALEIGRAPAKDRPRATPASGRALHYNGGVIHLARIVMTALTWLFLAGMAGSMLVIIISFIEDLTEVFGKE